MSSQKEKAIFSSVSNYTGKESLLYSANKILFNNKFYIREDNKWVECLESIDKFENIGFLPYNEYKRKVCVLQEEINKLTQELKHVKNKKNATKYKSRKNYEENKHRVKKVMKDINKMKAFNGQNVLEKRITEEVVWNEDRTERKKQLKQLYIESIKSTNSRTQVYGSYKRLSLWMQIYAQKSPNNSNYSEFYLDLKETIEKGFSETTKFVTRIELITKLFENLPSGSWAVCDVPVTFYNLIYKDCWNDIFTCIKDNSQFPYDKYFNSDIIKSMFGDLSLNESQDDNSVEEKEVGEEIECDEKE